MLLLHIVIIALVLSVKLIFCYLGYKAKKVGSKLKSRIIPEQSIVKWSQIIDEMEDQYSAVIREERFHFTSIKVLRYSLICLVLVLRFFTRLQGRESSKESRNGICKGMHLWVLEFNQLSLA